MKRCAHCKEYKDKSCYSKNKNKLYSYCKPCASVLNRASAAERMKDIEYRKQRNITQLKNRELNKNIRLSAMYHTAKRNAIKRDIEFTLTLDQYRALYEVQGWRCARTKIPFDFTMGKGKLPFGPAMDRVNPDGSYNAANVQIVCNVYNFAKNEFTDFDVLLFAFALVGTTR